MRRPLSRRRMALPVALRSGICGSAAPPPARPRNRVDRTWPLPTRATRDGVETLPTGPSATPRSSTHLPALAHEHDVEQPVWKHCLSSHAVEVTSDVGFLHRRRPHDRNRRARPAPLARRARARTRHRRRERAWSRTADRVKRIRAQPRVEDEFIRDGHKYMRTGRALAGAPAMTKSAVRALDTRRVSRRRPMRISQSPLLGSGASKRGWTTWATVPSNAPRLPRPRRIDLLNIEPSFEHHYRAYGEYSDAVKDYVEQGIMEWIGKPEFRALMKIEEPFEYRERLTMPKLLLNATGDQFFLPDSSQFYFDKLKGETHLRYVPNRPCDRHVRRA